MSVSPKNIWSEGKFVEPGWFRPARSDADYYPEHLIVFVHGVRSHWQNAWGRLPEFVMERLGVDVDLFSFSYPSGNLQSACYKRAAGELYTKLTTEEFQNYRHITFITHSTGGLVVKRALLEKTVAFKRRVDDGRVELLDRNLLITRVRRIINFGVPHRGGSWAGWILFTALAPLLFPTWTILHALNKVTSLLEASRGYPLGYNWIAPQLTWWWRDLVKLERNFNELLMELDKRGLPRPVSSDYVGSNDGAIANQYGDVHFSEGGEGVRTDADIIRVRGTHSLVKLPDNRDEFKVDVVVNELHTLFDQEAVKIAGTGQQNGHAMLDVLPRRTLLTLMDRTLDHMTRIAGAFDILSMVGDRDGDAAGYGQDERRTVEKSWIGSQAEVLRHLHDVCETNFNCQLVVTGSAGVGKSAVLRRFTSDLCTRQLLNDQASGVPLYMPLFRYGEIESDKCLLMKSGLQWDSFAEWWCRFANTENAKAARDAAWDPTKIAETPVITTGWLDTQLRHGRTVIILDGVDDFLVRNPTLGSASIISLTAAIRQRASGGQCAVILGIRSGLATPSFAVEGGILEVGRLTALEAESLIYLLRHQAVPARKRLTRIRRRLMQYYGKITAEEDRAVKGLVEKLQSLPEHLQEGRRSGRGLTPPEKNIRSELASAIVRLEAAEGSLSARNREQFRSALEQLDMLLVTVAVRALLDRVRNSHARKLILTPLILAKLIRGERFEVLTTPAEIFESALSIVIEESGLTPGVTTAQWIDALSLVAQFFFVSFLPSSEDKAILDGCAELHGRWSEHERWLEGERGAKDPELCALLTGFAVATNEAALRTALHRTVFLAVSRIRFEHREWEEYLAARHLKSAIMFGYVGGMCGRGSWTRMHFLIGDMLPTDAQYEFSSEFINRVRTCAQKMGLGKEFRAQIPIGNLLGVIGHSAMCLRPSVLKELLNHYLGRPIEEVPPLVELVALNTIGFRSLRRHSKDVHWLQNSRLVLETLRRIYRFGEQQILPRNALISFLAWLLGKAVANVLKEAWSAPPPPFDLSRDSSPALGEALLFTAHKSGSKWQCNSLDETMQRIFINLLPEMAEDGQEAKAISCVTYVPTLIAAGVHGVAVSEVASGLKVVFGPPDEPEVYGNDNERGSDPTKSDYTPEGARLHAAVSRFANDRGLPELRQLWEDCRAFYLKFLFMQR